ncbi:MAG: response regulator [Lachnospiraceae bacterium]|nr:response regulator [Candidatus Colinaster scatohippi]
MIKITYCDDSWIQQGLMDEWLKYYTAKKGITIEGVPFSTGNDLMAAVEHGASFDIYILDIILPGMRGTEVASKLRERGDNGKIIYLTSSSVFSAQSEEVNAFGYLVKPIQPEQLYEILDRAIAEIK